ncbi:Periplasmic nitrate reductase [Trichinella spiralis]|uniref:Periplasmic nitrate reductase n=1 Tax=Trichinella spiralis TaxID=6334 RepID=A0ABR3KT04_TRISP
MALLTIHIYLIIHRDSNTANSSKAAKCVANGELALKSVIAAANECVFDRALCRFCQNIGINTQTWMTNSMHVKHDQDECRTVSLSSSIDDEVIRCGSSRRRRITEDGDLFGGCMFHH